MKTGKFILAIFILVILFQINFAQEKKEAFLFDQIGEEEPCEFFLLKADAFFNELAKNPSTSGYVIIYGKNENWLRNLAYEFRFRGYINYRNFDKNRIEFVKSFEVAEFRMEFWIIPQSAKKPDISTKIWDFKISELNKPTNLNNDVFDEPCPDAVNRIDYAEILKANPNLRGHLVINTNTRKKFYERKRELSESLSPIEKSRLKFFYVESEYDYVEYWLVPKRKKK